MPLDDIGTTNWSLVAMQEDNIVFIRQLPPRLSRERALNLAAWLVAMADTNNEFPAILAAVKAT